MHNVVPVGPAVAGILAFPLGAIAMDFGIPMYAMLMVVAWEASVSYILPLDCVPVLTYSTGYYSMGQYAKAGIIPHRIPDCLHFGVPADYLHIVRVYLGIEPIRVRRLRVMSDISRP